MKWTVDNEIQLYGLICDYIPVGENKDKNLKILSEKMNVKLSDLISKLDTLYDLKWFEEEEEEEEEDEEEEEEEEEKEEVKVERKRPGRKRRLEVKEEKPKKRGKKAEEPKPTRRSSRRR
ncbi:hypothetical protein CLIB1444_03S11144 [[Candida] jaroonii]|uniref:Uncharacterized protein n=1 Tax=[Candida] jaroonii TaxID=467808 RepID=A0ACA9Y5Z9_9ASCO|nr:hypothetical protein CLIB1444_03S11144 [[Candida] jaroonii]